MSRSDLPFREKGSLFSLSDRQHLTFSVKSAIILSGFKNYREGRDTMKTKHVKRRHSVFFALARALVAPFLARRYGYKKTVYPSSKHKQYLILSNHQTLLDPALLAMNFKSAVYFIASDTLWNGSFVSRLLMYCFAPIKKRKAMADVSCIRTCLRVAKEGGTIAVFPEGNRSWTDTPLYIDPAICQLVRVLKLPLLLHRFEGGYGVDPRWSGSLRRGAFRGYVARELSIEEIAALSDEALYKIICDTLGVVDAESGSSYASPRRAEYAERLLFVCPRCHALSTMHSKGNLISCNKCNLTVYYREDTRLSSPDKDFSFKTLEEWAAFQRETVKSYADKKESVSLSDDGVLLYDKTSEKRKELAKGNLSLSSSALSLGSLVIPVQDIVSATVVGGKQLVVNTKERSYSFIGDDRFNAIKYVLFFHVLDTSMKEDKYYGL